VQVEGGTVGYFRDFGGDLRDCLPACFAFGGDAEEIGNGAELLVGVGPVVPDDDGALERELDQAEQSCSPSKRVRSSSDSTYHVTRAIASPSLNLARHQKVGPRT